MVQSPGLDRRPCEDGEIGGQPRGLGKGMVTIGQWGQKKPNSGSVSALGVFFFAESFLWLVQLCPHHTLQVVFLRAKTHSLVNYYF